MGLAAAAASLLAYLSSVYMLGFPDGYITELGHAERRLAYIFIWVSVALAACFIYLGAVAARKAVGKMLSASVVLYLVFVVALSLVDSYYRSHLDNGVDG
jgi:polyferredoxin